MSEGLSKVSPSRLGAYFRNRQEAGEPGLPTLSVTMNDGLLPRESLDRKMDTALSPSEHLRVRPGDIAYNMMRMWQGACGVADRDGMVSPAYVVLQPTDQIDSRFAFHWFKSPRMLHLLWAYSHGITADRLRLYPDDFARIPAAPPPLVEQRRIVTVLNAWDGAIAATERLIKEKQKRKQGLTSGLLGEVGGRSVRLGEIADINPAAPSVANNVSVSFIAMEDVSEEGRLIRHTDRSRSSIGNGYTGFVDNDVLVAKITPCFENGKGAFATNLTNNVGFGSTEFHVIRARRGVLPRLIFHQTRTESFRRRGVGMMSGSAGQKRVPAAFLEDYRVLLPSLQSQERIAALLDAADHEVDQLVEVMNCLRLQKRGLAQKLLTGAWRVPESAEALMPGGRLVAEAVA